MICIFFFFNDTATTEIYTLSLHDALPICVHTINLADYDVRDAVVAKDYLRAVGRPLGRMFPSLKVGKLLFVTAVGVHHPEDRKSTRLNSSHANISYAVFCLKKKKNRHRYD